MVFVSNTDASDLSALFHIPEGFSYGGNSSIIMDGKASSCEPTQVGQSLRWDLKALLKSCRSVVINEWEQNPAGTDTGKEWIELYNPTSQAVNIGGWKLVDSYSGKSVKIAAGTVIASDGYQVLPWTNGSLINSYLDQHYTPGFLGQRGRSDVLMPRMKRTTDSARLAIRTARIWEAIRIGNSRRQLPGHPMAEAQPTFMPGNLFALSFNLTPGCDAPRQASLSGEILSSGGTISAPSLPSTVRRANLTLSATPDRFDVSKGDVVDWTVLLENDGDGTAYGVAFNATLDTGLQLISLDSTAPEIVRE